MVMVCFLQGSLPNKDVFLSLQNMMFGPGQLCSAVFELKWYFDIHIHNCDSL